jgi:hypothetical protein
MNQMAYGNILIVLPLHKKHLGNKSNLKRIVAKDEGVKGSMENMDYKVPINVYET